MANGENPQENGGQGQAQAPTAEMIERLLPNNNEVGTRQIPQDSFPIPERQQPYIWPRGESTPDRWVQDSERLKMIRSFKGAAPAPWAPQIHEARDVIRRAGTYFVQNGSRPQAIRAARMTAWNDKYWKDYMNAEYLQARIDHQVYENEQEQFTKAQRLEFALFHDAWNTYKDNPQKFTEAIEGLSRRFQDSKLREWNAAGGPALVMKNISDRVNYNEALLHTAQQRANVEKQELDNARIRDENAQDERDLAGTSPPGHVTDPDRIAGTSGPKGTESDATHGIPQSPVFIRDVRDTVTSGKLGADVSRRSQRYQTAVKEAASNQEAELRALADGIPPNLTDDEKKLVLAKIDRLNPTIGEHVSNFLNKVAEPTATVSSKDPGWGTALKLAEKITPGLSLRFAHEKEISDRVEKRAALYSQMPALRTGFQTLYNLKTAIPKNLQDFNQLVTFATNMGGSYVPIVARWQRWIRGEIEGDPQITAFATLMENMKEDIAIITRSFGGRQVYTVNAQRAMDRLLNPAANPYQLEAAAETLKSEYAHRLEPLAAEYNATVAKIFPGQNLEEDVSGIMKLLEIPKSPMPSGGKKIRD